LAKDYIRDAAEIKLSMTIEASLLEIARLLVYIDTSDQSGEGFKKW